MKTRKQYDEKIAELIAERDALPPDVVIADLEPGVYAYFGYILSRRRYFIKGQGKCWSHPVFSNGEQATTAEDLQSAFDEGKCRDLVKLCDLDAKPLEKIDVDWDNLKMRYGQSLPAGVHTTYCEDQLLKIARWARPLLEGLK